MTTVSNGDGVSLRQNDPGEFASGFFPAVAGMLGFIANDSVKELVIEKDRPWGGLRKRRLQVPKTRPLRGN